jgi:PAS domain S-box-containing protein
MIMYYLSARAGLLLAYKNTNATPVWPPSGIALAALLLFGYRIWPGIMLGAFFVNIVVFLSNQTDPFITLWVSLFISIGNTLSAVFGCFLLKKMSEDISKLEKLKHILAFALVVLIMCLVSSGVGSTAICITKIIPWEHYPVVWFTWWLGDVTGVLILAPLLLSWNSYFETNWKWNKKIIGIVLFYGLVFFFSGLIFCDWLSANSPYIKPYLIIPLLLWAAFYFDKRTLATAIALSSATAIWGTMSGRGPFAGASMNDSLLSLQMYISIVCLTVMTLKAIIHEREQSETLLRNSLDKLTLIAKERKEDLEEYQKRIDIIFQAILKYTLMDFSRKTPISEKGDEIDAIAAGLNTLSEELEFYISKLRESEERFRLLVESVKDYAIFMIDPNGYIISWNKGAESIKGYTSEEIIGKHMSVFYTPEEIERGDPQYNLRMALEKGHHESIGWRVRKDGSRFWADVILTPLFDQSKKLKGYVKVTRDISERKKAEAELNQKSEELARSNQELEQFAYVASHDLQEPLRMVNSYVQLLSNRYKDKLDKDANEFIAFAVDGSNRMRALIQSLLEYSRVNRAKPFERIDTNEVVKEVEHDLKNIITENNAVIKIENLPVIVGDTVLIGQLFQNLIINAIKFRGVDNPEIIISGKKINNEYLFSVKDNGIGIKKEYFEKIFTIFQRLHGADKYPGTGIGLAICKKIVARHGGKIWLESEPGKGSTFYFTIAENKK